MKFLYVTMLDNSVWRMNAEIIAKDKATYYMNIKGYDYEEILNETLSNQDLLIDWAENNMAWIDVKDDALMIKKGNIDYDAGWFNGNKHVVEE